MQITFAGAAGTVTGSKFLLSHNETNILVDCGLFQGVKALRRRNWEPLPVKPKAIDGVILTHAHLDHSGYFPVLVKQGIQALAYCTQPTKDLCKILLPDSGYLQEEDAYHANKHGYSKHSPAMPLYTQADAEKALSYFKAVPYEDVLKIGDFEIQFFPCGHILGAASVLIKAGGKAILFTGDLGRPGDLLTPLEDVDRPADVLVMESTYGDRLHERVDAIQAVADLVTQTTEKGGTLLIPAFAVGRTQSLLYCLHAAFKQGLAPKVPVYVNSPMATNVTDIYERYPRYHLLSKEESQAAFGVARYVNTTQESKSLNKLTESSVIISASGMLTGGRVLHHLKALAPDPKNTILLTGYQAPGTRGASLASGADHIKIHGQYIPVNADVKQIDFLSAHADQSEFIQWLQDMENKPERIFLVHGDPQASDALRLKIEENFRLPVHIAEHMETMDLG